MQPEDQVEQAVLNKKLYEWSAKKDIKLVAAGDCHYPTADDHEAHEIMLAIQTHDKLDNPDRYSFGDCRVYMRRKLCMESFKDLRCVLKVLEVTKFPSTSVPLMRIPVVLALWTITQRQPQYDGLTSTC